MSEKPLVLHTVMGAGLENVLSIKETGEYLVSSEGSRNMPARIRYTAGNETLPTAILLPGFRGDALAGTNNLNVAKNFISLGFPVAQLNYGGFDHYNDAEETNSADSATMHTNINDLRNAVDVIEAEKIVYVSNCYSINTSVQVMDERVDNIIFYSPYPDLIQGRILNPVIENKPHTKRILRDLEEQDFFLYNLGEGKRPVKVTIDFINSALGFSSFLALDDAIHKPKLSMVYFKDDPFVEPQGIVEDWIKSARSNDFDVNVFPLEGRRHSPTTEMLETIEEVAQEIINEANEVNGVEELEIS